MPRGRHRHSPPLHRLLPPSAIAGISLVCALGPWVFTEPSVLRVSAAGAAAPATVGAAVMRRWDVEAGKRVADLTRARASDEWRHEEQAAELETDLEESRELRQKLEHKLRAKRAELASLRNEHAALLRRYATAETERASALEGRRLLVIEASTAPDSVRALPAGTGDAAPSSPSGEAGEAPEAASQAASGDGVQGASQAVRAQGAEGASQDEATDEAASAGAGEGEAVAAASDEQGAEGAAEEEAAKEKRPGSGVFSPHGSPLFPRANSALDRIIKGDLAKAATTEKGEPADTATVSAPAAPAPAPSAPMTPAPELSAHAPAVAAGASVPGTEAPAAQQAPSAPAAPASRPALPAQASGHFTVPTAVAVAPETPRRRPSVEGGFDFFGTQKGAAAIEAVQNEDLADVVGQEALVLHKAESEAQFKPADENSRVGQVIDLTAHDETEQIDVKGLRSAVS